MTYVIEGRFSWNNDVPVYALQDLENERIVWTKSPFAAFAFETEQDAAAAIASAPVELRDLVRIVSCSRGEYTTIYISADKQGKRPTLAQLREDAQKMFPGKTVVFDGIDPEVA